MLHRDAKSDAVVDWDANKPSGEEDVPPSDDVHPEEMETLASERHQTAEAWAARQEEFRVLKRKLIIATMSHHSLKDRARLVIALQDRAVERKIVFYKEQYEEMFHALAAAAHPFSDDSVASNRLVDPATATIDRPLPSRLVAERQQHGLSSHAPSKAAVVLQAPYLDSAWAIFEFMVHAGVDITLHGAQCLMEMLAAVHAPDPTTESRAHQLVMRLDTLQLIPSRVTLTRYFQVCATNGCMHIAVARFADARLRHEIIPTAAMCTAIVVGLTRNGQIEQALSFISCLGGVAVDQALVNACMNAAAQHRQEPLTSFRMWRAIATTTPSGIRLDGAGAAILLGSLKSARQLADDPALAQLERERLEKAPKVTLRAVPRGAGQRLGELAFLYAELRRARQKLAPRQLHHLVGLSYAAMHDLLAVLDARAASAASAGSNPDELHVTSSRGSSEKFGGDDMLGATRQDDVAAAFRSGPPRLVFEATEHVYERMLRAPRTHARALRFLREWQPVRDRLHALLGAAPPARRTALPPRTQPSVRRLSAESSASAIRRRLPSPPPRAAEAVAGSAHGDALRRHRHHRGDSRRRGRGDKQPQKHQGPAS